MLAAVSHVRPVDVWEAVPDAASLSISLYLLFKACAWKGDKNVRTTFLLTSTGFLGTAALSGPFAKMLFTISPKFYQKTFMLNAALAALGVGAGFYSDLKARDLARRGRSESETTAMHAYCSISRSFNTNATILIVWAISDLAYRKLSS